MFFWCASLELQGASNFFIRLQTKINEIKEIFLANLIYCNLTVICKKMVQKIVSERGIVIILTLNITMREEY